MTVNKDWMKRVVPIDMSRGSRSSRVINGGSRAFSQTITKKIKLNKNLTKIELEYEVLQFSFTEKIKKQK